VTVRPRVVVSKCLEFAACRYDGQMINDPVVALLKEQVEFLPVCAECEIGLGVPREPIRLVQQGNMLQVLQPATGRDATAAMLAFCRTFMADQHDLDGFLLKSKSPSCGVGDVRIYPSVGKVAALGRGRGIFGGAARESFPDLAIEDEARLSNYRIREHYFTRLWASARLRAARAAGTMRALVKFHADHKLLLLAHSEKEMRLLGKIVANPARRPLPALWDEYAAGLARALANPARLTAMINVLQHAFGHVTDRVRAAERRHFLAQVEKYRTGKLPLSAVTALLAALVVRFEVAYLADQTFFAPYPEQLMLITDSGKGRPL